MISAHAFISIEIKAREGEVDSSFYTLLLVISSEQPIFLGKEFEANNRTYSLYYDRIG